MKSIQHTCSYNAQLLLNLFHCFFYTQAMQIDCISSVVGTIVGREGGRDGGREGGSGEYEWEGGFEGKVRERGHNIDSGWEEERACWRYGDKKD